MSHTTNSNSRIYPFFPKLIDRCRVDRCKFGPPRPTFSSTHQTQFLGAPAHFQCCTGTSPPWIRPATSAGSTSSLPCSDIRHPTWHLSIGKCCFSCFLFVGSWGTSHAQRAEQHVQERNVLLVEHHGTIKMDQGSCHHPPKTEKKNPVAPPPQQ